MTAKVQSYEVDEARVPIEQSGVVTAANLAELKIADYDMYFEEQHQREVASGKAVPGELAPVSQYQDKLTRIETTEAYSVMLHVPYA